MKKFIRVLMLFFALSAFAVSYSYAQQIVVSARLHDRDRDDVRPARPSPRHVWVRGEWVPNGATYAWHAGYWAIPQRPGGAWVRGHWARRPGGWVWIPGHWN